MGAVGGLQYTDIPIEAAYWEHVSYKDITFGLQILYNLSCLSLVKSTITQEA